MHSHTYRRVARSARPGALAARSAARWLRARAVLGKSRRQQAREEAMLRTAEDVTRTMGEMKGAVMKIGQVLSLMTGAVPDEMALQLASLHSDAPPMAYALVERVFREEFGASPQKLFARFQKQPFAAASIGQVHRALTHDGRRVAVKVQYPGVREAIEADLANVGWLVSAAGMFARGINTDVLIRDLKSGILAELDYCREAANQARFARLYQDHAFLRIPQVYPDLSTGRVLVQEFLPGRPLVTARTLPQSDRDRIAEMLFRYTFGNFYRHGLFNGDPHPGNYLLLDDGSLGCLDFGCVTEFDDVHIARFRAVLDALFREDREGWRTATERVGIIRPGNPYSTDELYDHMHWFWKPVLEPRMRFTRELAAEMVRRNTMTTGQGGAINRQLDIPEGMVFLTRINFGLAGLLASLEAEGPWQGIIREYVYGEPPCTELGRRSAATTNGPPV